MRCGARPRRGQRAAACLLLGLAACGVSAEAPGRAKGLGAPPAATQMRTNVQYLVFQLTTYDANPEGRTQPLAPAFLEASIERILAAVGGVRGDGASRQLGFAVGPIAFDHTDEEVRRTIRESFRIAREKDVAVALHLDLSMFWKRLDVLWRKPANIEWLGWDGTPSTGRKIDWGRPLKLAPQMCLNSDEIRETARRRARDVVGASVVEELLRLRAEGREHLFAGVIAGWETQLGRDFDTDHPVGYCALANRGFSAANPPADPDAEREAVLREYVELWTGELAAAGVDRDKLYSHVAFVPRVVFEGWKRSRADLAQTSYAEAVHFAPPRVAFGSHHHPGFSTYPAPGIFDEIYGALRERGSPPWASSEGTNCVIGGRPGDSGVDMEGYLAKMFNHGATLVNLFAWGVGGEAGRSNPFRQATEERDALAAYSRFLRGEPLRERIQEPIISPDGVAAKMHEVREALPAWLRAGGSPARVDPLMREFQGHIQAGRLREADRVADELLALVAERPTASPEAVAAKVQRVQRELPPWLRAGGRPEKVESLLEELQIHMQAGRWAEADRAADALLEIIGP